MQEMALSHALLLPNGAVPFALLRYIAHNDISVSECSNLLPISADYKRAGRGVLRAGSVCS